MRSKKDHRQNLINAIKETQMSVNHLYTQIIFLRQWAEGGKKLDENYREVSKELRILADKIDESIDMEEDE